MTLRLNGLPFVKNFRPAPDSRIYIRDFYQEWASARNLLNGQPVYQKHEESLRRYLGFRRNPADPFFIEYNAHPPTSVLLGVPLAGLDYPEAFLVWDLISLGLFGVSVWLVVRQLHLRITLWNLAVAVPVLLLCNPFVQNFNQGQLNIVLLLLLTGAWSLDRSGRPGWAGVLVGAATAIKLFPGFLLLYFAARGRWRAVLTGVLSLAALTGLTLGIVGLETYQEYWHVVLPHVARCRDWWLNASVPGFWSKLFEAPSEHSVPLVDSPALFLAASALCCVPLCLVLLAAIRRARTRDEHDLVFSLALVTMLLVAPITWDHYLVLLLVPLALLWVRWRRLGGWIWLYLICLAAFWVPPAAIFDYVQPGGTEASDHRVKYYETLISVSYQCYALLGLFAVLTAAICREQSSARPVPAAHGNGRVDSAADPSGGSKNLVADQCPTGGNRWHLFPEIE
jgi:hypothetical protein